MLLIQLSMIEPSKPKGTRGAVRHMVIICTRVSGEHAALAQNPVKSLLSQILRSHRLAKQLTLALFLLSLRIHQTGKTRTR
jgi:hypothetical protein